MSQATELARLFNERRPKFAIATRTKIGASIAELRQRLSNWSNSNDFSDYVRFKLGRLFGTGIRYG